jgi:hypothetical protein
MARVVVIGQSGTGKSYYTGYLLEVTVPEFGLAIHYDIEDEEIGLSHKDHDPIYSTFEPTPSTARKIDWQQFIAKYKKIRIVPEGMTMDQKKTLYAVICQSVMDICQKHRQVTAFVSCDEAHNLVPQTAFDDRVERLITGGRKHGAECLHISQRPQLLHTTVISQGDRRIYFRVNDDNDISKINKISSFDARKLESLPDRTCIVENKSTGDYKQIDTNGISRTRPHFSGDDGIVDKHLPV